MALGIFENGPQARATPQGFRAFPPPLKGLRGREEGRPSASSLICFIDIIRHAHAKQLTVHTSI